MQTTIFNFIFASMSIAGTAVIWRNWIEDHKTWKEWLMQNLKSYHKVLTCGSCFTYWLALGITILASPLSIWLPLGTSFSALAANIFLQWMALAWLSVFLRFAYVALQELVNYQVHTLREHVHEHK